MARKVKCRITGEMIDKELAIKVGDKFYTESLYAEYEKLKERKDKCISIYKKKIGVSERMPVPAINKIIDDFVDWYSVDAVEILLQESYQLKGTNLNGRVAYLKAVMNNKIVAAQLLVDSKKRAVEAQPIIEAPAEVIPKVDTPTKSRRKKMFF